MLNNDLNESQIKLQLLLILQLLFIYLGADQLIYKHEHVCIYEVFVLTSLSARVGIHRNIVARALSWLCS